LAAGTLAPSSGSLRIKSPTTCGEPIHAAEYWSERVKMMQAWADYLDELRDGGKVLPLARRAKKYPV
jgi:hypothetical protein